MYGRSEGSILHRLGCRRGGLKIKIYAIAFGQGPPVQLGLIAKQTSNGLIDNRLPDHLGSRTIALDDRAYDADCF